MKLDRQRQRLILEDLAAIYPDYSTNLVQEGLEETDIANLYYLQDHGLVIASLTRTLGGSYVFEGATITAKGLDFLADDGGLSAILGVVTIRLHSESVRALLETRLEESELPAEQKTWIREKLSSLPDEALKTITTSLIQQGLQHVPDLYKWIKSLLSTLS